MENSMENRSFAKYFALSCQRIIFCINWKMFLNFFKTSNKQSKVYSVIICALRAQPPTLINMPTISVCKMKNINKCMREKGRLLFVIYGK